MGKATSIEKGMLWLLFSNLIFFLSGYVIYIGLGRFFLTPAEFGVFGVVMALNSLTDLVLLIGINQATAKFVSENEDDAEAVKNASMKIQAAFSIIFFAVYFALAGFIAQLLNDVSMTPLIQLSAVIILFQPILSVVMGYFNGLKRFKEQAILRIIYRASRVLLVFGLVLLGFSLFGAVAGIVLSTVFAFVVGILWTGIKGTAKKFPVKKIIYFAIPIILMAIVQRALLSIDLLFVKSLLPAAQAGFYTAAQTISTLPHDFVAFTFSMVLFPLVSKSIYQQNLAKTQFYIKNAFRYSLLVLAPLAVLIVANAHEIIALVYSSSYALGSMPLAILSIGIGFYSLFIIATTIISSSGKPWISTVIGFAIIIISIALNALFVPLQGMVGAAAASATAMFAGFLVSAAYVLFKFKALISSKSAAKILLASLVILLLSNLWPVQGLVAFKCLVLLALYAGLLWLLKEFNATDLAVFKNLLPEGSERDS